MKITCPPGLLVVDVSLWADHLHTKELLEAGVVSVIVGLYKKWDGKKYVLNDNCKRMVDQVIASNLVLQTYYYYYPQLDPIKEADWFVSIMFTAGYPVKFAWADLEDHSATMAPLLRSEQNRRFTQRLYDQFPNTGVYTANWYTSGYCSDPVTHRSYMGQWLGKYPAWVAHYGDEPAQKMKMTWDQLKAQWLPNYNIILAEGQIPSLVVGHQFTDRCILPGSYDKWDGLIPFYDGRMPLDVSVFTSEFIARLDRNAVPVQPSSPVTPLPNWADYIVASAAVNIRNGPAVSAKLVQVVYQGTKLHLLLEPDQGVMKIIVQNGYAQLFDGSWVYLGYLKKV